jgi:phosphohistidine phosphatase SixA
MRRDIFLVLCGLALAVPSLVNAQEDPIVVYIVRHAERADDGATATDDPPLSAAGWERADLLARVLADAGLTRIHSTDFVRTRSTGQPTSEATGLDIESYDPRDLANFAGRLSTTPGRHLVVGHSDTSAHLVEVLGGPPSDPIAPLEYDRLYIVTLVEGRASSVLIRFGDPYDG